MNWKRCYLCEKSNIMSSDLIVLCGLALSVGTLHTIMGPDHYLPFIFLSRARNWSKFKTAWVTALCGFGHVGSTLVIGLIGGWFGLQLSRLEYFQDFSVNISASLMVVFGGIYLIWGIYRAVKNKPHKHVHFHEDGDVHQHTHTHIDDHNHLHENETSVKLTPWVLFLIFAFGPCEAFIPTVMYPAMEQSLLGLILVTTLFAISTIGTMVIVVSLVSSGFKMIPLGKLERFTHVIAGATVFFSGVAILVF